MTSLSTQFSRRTALFTTLAVVALISAVFWVSGRGGLGSAVIDNQPVSYGAIDIADTPFPFDPETCAVLDGAFIAAGPGQNGFGEYWVSASESKIEILFNVASEVDTPPPGFPWLQSEDIGWSSPAEGQVVAVTRMTATRDLLTSGRGTLELTCR